MRVVVALGGNALLRRGEPASLDIQRRRLSEAAEVIAALCRSHEVILTHGNGPQIGYLALAAGAVPGVPPDALDVLGAQSEGLIGYLIEQELGNRLPGRDLATLLTQLVVDAADPAFANPSKPIGPVYPAQEAEHLARIFGWTLVEEGKGKRRVVASPEPQRIVEIAAIRHLVAAGVVVICAGGGGIPVVERDGSLHGVAAVIDKDLAAALLALEVKAAALLLLTDVDAVYRDFGSPAATPLREADIAALRSMRLPPGSMGPKVEAACRFVEGGGALAAIGCLNDAERLLAGTAGTRVLVG